MVVSFEWERRARARGGCVPFGHSTLHTYAPVSFWVFVMHRLSLWFLSVCFHFVGSLSSRRGGWYFVSVYVSTNFENSTKCFDKTNTCG